MSRSGYYYEPAKTSAENLALMRLIDEQYTRAPFYGIRRMTAWLSRERLAANEQAVNHKRIARLMSVMGLEGVCPRPRTSIPAPGHKIYPYLLRDVTAQRRDHIWSTDITYIRMKGGFVYLVAVMDWYSRYVLSWEVSNSLDGSFCVAALETALEMGQPEIFNSDQGVQFTSGEFTKHLLARKIQISMDGRGRAMDNIFIERLWRSVKYEEVYLKDYESVSEAVESLGRYFQFYNEERLHQSLGYEPPSALYLGN